MSGRGWSAIAVVIVATATIVICDLVSAFSFVACENTPLKTLSSPDGRHKVVIFDRDCGATTGFSNQVSILPARAELPDDGGNIFIADLPAPHIERRPVVEARWQSAGSVELHFTSGARIFKMETTIGAISIAYAEVAQMQ